MIRAELSVEFDAPGVVRPVDGYRASVSAEAGLVASEFMRQGMRRVSPGTPASPPGGFPYARSGKIRDRIGWSVGTDGEVLVGPELATPPTGYDLSGGKTIPQILNEGGRIRIRRRVVGNNIQRPRTLIVRPRPYVDLTLEFVAQRLPAIAEQTPLEN